MQISKFLLIVGLLGALAHHTLAWHCTGHQLVAQVAYAELQVLDQEKLTQMNEVLDVLKELADENMRPFVEGACWPDVIKQWFGAYDKWHYKSLPTYRDDYPQTATVDPLNAVWALHELEDTLKEDHDTNNAKLMKSQALRLYIHIVGDVHQPLHTASLYSEEFPEGDIGGNRFSIKYKDYTQMHFLWDAGCDQYTDDRYPQTSIDAKLLKYYIEEAKSLTSQYTRQFFSEELKIIDYDAWVLESNDKAKTHVYKDIEVGAELTDAYIAEGKTVVKKQITLGGYRLADRLAAIFKTTEEQPTKSSDL